MKGYHANIEELTVENTKFREVLYTSSQLQLVLMSLKPGEEIGEERHPENDQFFRFEQGTGTVIVDDNKYAVSDGTSIIVPKGAKHNVINEGNTPLKMYTIYAPPHHKDGTLHTTKQEAEENDEDFDGQTTE